MDTLRNILFHLLELSSIPALIFPDGIRLWNALPPPPRHSHYGGDADVRLQRPPIFSAAVTQWPHIFADCLCCCHPKISTCPTFFGDMCTGLFNRYHLFFAFGCHRKLLFVLISSTNWSFFAIFDHFFFSNSCFSSTHWKIKSNILTQCPLMLNQNLASHPMTPHFLRWATGFHRMPAAAFGSVWALNPCDRSYFCAPYFRFFTIHILHPPSTP